MCISTTRNIYIKILGVFFFNCKVLSTKMRAEQTEIIGMIEVRGRRKHYMNWFNRMILMYIMSHISFSDLIAQDIGGYMH